MKMLKNIILFLLFILNNNFYGQSTTSGDNLLPTIFSASPNASSLGTYGQIPVNLFNGMPNININLYKIRVDNFELPVSISYHLASVKPEERPSWVGLGWNLNAGGAITRIVNGGVDEVMVSNFSDPTVFSYLDHYSTLNTVDWFSNLNMNGYKNCLTSFAPTSFCVRPAPDEFMFNVNGLSGSFFKNHNGEWIVKANQRVDVKIDEELKYDFKLKEIGNHPADTRIFDIKRILYGFKLTTDDGIQYVFGKTPNAIEFTASADSQQDGFHPNFVVKTWYLTKIILPNNKNILFEYKTNTIDTSPGSEVGDTTNKAVYKPHVSASFMNYYSAGSVGGSYQSSQSGGLTNKSLERQYLVYLDKISTTDTEIIFNNSLSNDLDYYLLDLPWGEYTIDYTHNQRPGYENLLHWYKLDNFIVKNKIDNKQIYKASFNFIENPTSRLFLSEINESGILNSNTNRKHSFEYNPTSLPPYNSQKEDHWGFYNGTNFYDNVSPADGLYYSVNQIRDFYSLYRNPNALFMKAGVLTKINFPTGGATSFFYEPHDFSKVVEKTTSNFSLVNAVSSNELAGGLRIAKIISDPLDTGTSITKEYFYVKDYKNNDFSSSGILSGRPVYIEEGLDNGVSYFKMSSNSLTSLNSTNGNHVTYSNVVEKISDGSFTEYTYTNHDNGYLDKVANNYKFGVSDNNLTNTLTKKISFNSLECERGNILSEKKYDFQKNLLEKTNYFYNDSPTRFNDNIRSIDFSETVIGSIQQDEIPVSIGHVKVYYKMAAYSIFSHQVYLKKKERTEFDLVNGTSVTTTNDYTYSNVTNHHHLKSDLMSSLVTGNVETKYFYPLDNEMVNEPVRNELIAKYMVGKTLNTQQFKNNEKISEQSTKYYSFATGDINNPTSLQPQFIYSKKGDVVANNLEKKITFEYDEKGNIKQYILENGITVSVIWGYNKTLPIAKIENFAFSSLNATVLSDLQNNYNIEGNEIGLITALASLRNTLPVNSFMTSYTYKPLLGISTITDSKGYTTYYEYDDYGRLKLVKDNDGKIINDNQYNYKN